MTSLTIRKLEDSLKKRLRLRAAKNGRSMEEEARNILRGALATERDEQDVDLGTAIHRLFAPLGGVDLQPPAREPASLPPRLDE
jgi:plasmid stability protein